MLRSIIPYKYTNAKKVFSFFICSICNTLIFPDSTQLLPAFFFSTLHM